MNRKIRNNIRFILMTFLIIFLLNNAFTQKFRFGGIVGFNLARWEGDVLNFTEDLNQALALEDGYIGFNFKNQFKLTPAIGVFGEYQVTNKLFLHAELLYLSKGGKIKHNGRISFKYGGEIYSMDIMEMMNYRGDYLEIPLLLKYHFLDSDRGCIPYVIAGVSGSLLLVSQFVYKEKIDDDIYREAEKFNGMQYYDFGLNGGIGIAIEPSIIIEARYQGNFIPIFKEDYDDSYFLYNTLISLNFQFYFNH